MHKKQASEVWQQLCLTLKNQAKDKGITHEAIAEATGISKNNVTRLLNGQYETRASSMIAICTVINPTFLSQFQKLLEK